MERRLHQRLAKFLSEVDLVTIVMSDKRGTRIRAYTVHELAIDVLNCASARAQRA